MPEPCCPTCRLAVTQHPAGRCLDAWVVEAVLGYQRLEGEAIPIWITAADVLRERAHCRRVWLGPSPGEIPHYYCEECGTLPCYSQDIDAAWDIVTHLNSQGIFVSILLSSTGRHGLVEIRALREATLLITQAAEVPLALCQTALGATLATQEERDA